MTDDTQNKAHDLTRLYPLEVTDETIKDFELDPKSVVFTKVGNRRIRAIMVPVSNEIYTELMRPLWREEKYKQRHGDMISFDQMFCKTDYVAPSHYEIETIVTDKLFLQNVQEIIAKLDARDRTIIEMYLESHSEAEIAKVVGMSQRGVNKRKRIILSFLRTEIGERFNGVI